MGLFLSASGLFGVSSADVESCLQAYQSKKQRQFYAAAGTTTDAGILVMSETAGHKVFLLYPDGFLEWDELSGHLSQELQCPVFSFHIHDGDLWLYNFFVRGEQIGCFNPIPDYWGEVSDEEVQNVKGDASVISAHWPDVTIAINNNIGRYCR